MKQWDWLVNSREKDEKYVPFYQKSGIKTVMTQAYFRQIYLESSVRNGSNIP